MSKALISNSVTHSVKKYPQNPLPVELKQSLTEADQQARFLHLQAEVELLWQEVQRSRHNN